MIKKFFSALVVVLFATSMMAQTGLTCEDPIPVDENYVGVVSGPCELWYTAWTYDLPLNVHFIPDSDNSQISPEIEVDFTCVPGVYADPKLDSLINLVDDYDVTFPLELMGDLVTPNGKNEWNLSVNKSYREQLAQFGLPYNIQAYVKVKFYESGKISLKPDTLFKNCMESAEYLHLGDTIDISPNDVDPVFVLPYTDWQEDSIRYVWIGEQSATIYAAVQECSFEPSTTNGFVWTTYNVTADVPCKLYPSQMKTAIKENVGGGLFYGKVIAPVAGKLVVEKIPMASAEGGATLLEYGKSVQIVANDTNALFCFPRTWSATHFEAVTDFGVTMYVSNVPEFTTTQNVINDYIAQVEDNTRSIYISNKEMVDLTKQAEGDYLYVRFRCASTIAITPNAWDASNCAGESYLINPNEAFAVKTNATNTIYRLRYADYVGYDMVIKWTGNGDIIPYIADTCNYSLTTTNSHLVLRPAPTIKRRGSYTIDAATLDTWASRVDSDGYLYVRLGAKSIGNITFKTEKPVPADPEIVTNPCVEASTKLNIGDQLTLNLNNAFTVYCINYAEWAAPGATLQWTGEEPLHTFVAETCQFAVAPYNKFVHLYLPITAETALDMNALAPYVDDAGYLYIRFLTEKEGVLTIK